MTNLESYLLSVESIKAMLKKGMIDENDYLKAERFLAEKYCIKKVSLYRGNDLINSSFRVMYIHDKKEVKSNETS